MRDDLRVNISANCSLCPPDPDGRRNYVRVRVGDPQSATPRLAVCPVHDIAGPVEALPLSLRPTLPRSDRHA